MAKRKRRTRRAAREPMVINFGDYLKALRIHKNIRASEIAAELGLTASTISNIEKGFNPPPTEARLKIWLRVLGETSRYGEASRLLKAVKRSRTIKYVPRNPANEHIDRLIDAYDADTLTETDIKLLQMVAPQEYR